MTIKGKRKSKPRPVARAPRRQPIEVKPPLFQRRWVQVTIAFIAGFLAMMFVVWVTNGLREGSRTERARERAAAERATTRPAAQAWSDAVDGAIAPFVQPGGPGTPPTLLTAASAAIDGIAAGDPVRGAAGALEEAETDLSAAIRDLGPYDLVDQIRDRGFDITQTNYLLNSEGKILDALELYRQAVRVAREALERGGRLGRVAAGLRDQAVSLFSDGWLDLQQVSQSVGIQPVAGAGS